MNVSTFLKILTKYGYPNPSVVAIANSVDYNLDYFLHDLKKEMGEDGVLAFCDRAIEKLTGEKGLRIDMGGPNEDEYVYIHIYPVFYDEDESENDVVSNHGWGESRLLGTDENGQEKYMTIEEIIENTDMGGWSELDELLDEIKSQAYNKVYYNCGFGVWWQ